MFLWVGGGCSLAFGAVDFDGVDDNVTVADSASLDITGQMSIALWFKLTGAAPEYTAPIIKTNGGFNGYGIFFTNDVFVGSVDSIAFFVTDYSTNTGYKSFSYSTDQDWHHVVGVYNGTNVQIYVDGVIGTDDAYAGAVTTNANDLFIASGSSFDDADMPGLIDDVRVYNRALSASEIEVIYKGRLKYDSLITPGNELVGYWPLDDQPDGTSGDGDTFVDRSGNGNNGTGVDGANNTGLTARASGYLMYPARVQ